MSAHTANKEGGQAAEKTDVPHETLSEKEFHRMLCEVTPHLRAFARSLTRDRDRSDDLAQEAVLRAWAARDSYRAGTNFKAWTLTILRNQFYSEMRRARYTADYDENYAEQILWTPGAQEDSVDLADVKRALDTLPDTHREALILVAIGDLSYEEIAQVCGIALGTVKSRICRARSMLTNVLETGQLPDFRHNFVLSGEVIDAFFAELGDIVSDNEKTDLAA